MSLNGVAFLPKRGTAAKWTAANPVLGPGEIGFETDTRKEKRGDGVTAWNSLPYNVSASDLNNYAPVAEPVALMRLTVNEAPLSPLRYGSAPTGTSDDTATIQATLDALPAGGGAIDLGPYTWRVSTVQFHDKTRILGRGRRASILDQIAGMAGPVVKPYSTTSSYSSCLFDKFGITGFSNQAQNLGGLILEGVRGSEVDIYVGGINFAGVQVKGGTGAQGDSMRNRVRVRGENLVAGAAFVRLTPSAGGIPALGNTPSKPDGTELWLDLNSNNSTAIGLLIEAPADLAGYQGVDSIVVHSPRMQEVHIPYDISAVQGMHVVDGRHECTSGTMTVYVRAGTTNFPTADNFFINNRWPTYADPTKFVFSDSGANTQRWGEYPRGGSAGDQGTPIYRIVRYGGEYAYEMMTNGDTNPRFRVRADGQIELGSGTAAPNVQIARTNSGIRTFSEVNTLYGSGTSISFSSNKGGGGYWWQFRADGQFNLGPGDGTFDTGFLRRVAKVLAPSNSGVFSEGTFTTAGRPSASAVGAGACYYDMTLSKPAWSDGTNWRDASGTVV